MAGHQHATAPGWTGANRRSLTSSAHMMPEHPGWNEAANREVRGFEGAAAAGTASHVLDRQPEGATLVNTPGFAEALVYHID
jgi:isocitrate dehydrogenase